MRGFIFDSSIARLKDEKETKNYKTKELSQDLSIYYTLTDEIWVSWLEKTFWDLFSQSPSSTDRITELEKINEKTLQTLKK